MSFKRFSLGRENYLKKNATHRKKIVTSIFKVLRYIAIKKRLGAPFF